MRPVSLPLAAWPEEDKLLWEQCFCAGDFLDSPGPLRHLRMTSRHALTKLYGRWLEWLFLNLPACLSESPVRRASPELLWVWIATLGHTTPVYRLNLIQGVLQILKVASPEQDWTVHKRLLTQLARESRCSISMRKNGRILNSRGLLDAGLSYSGRANETTNTDLNAALRRRDGTIIAFLSLIPIRLGSLSKLSIGSSVHVSPKGVEIHLTPEMTKTGVQSAAFLPNSLLPTFLNYLNETRRWLMARGGQDHAHLWINRLGGPLCYGTIANMVPRVTHSITGVKVSPHLFRDCAVTTIATEAPKELRLATPLLGHSCIETAQRHYNHASGSETRRAYAALVAQDRVAR